MTPTAGDVPPTLLCVCNFPTNTGFAWDFIEGLYAGIADEMATRGVRTLVAYPQLAGQPRALAGHPVEPIELDAVPAWMRLAGSMRFIRHERVRVLYLVDFAATSLMFPLLRLAGARHIIVHDHTSGERTAASGMKRVIKWALARVPGLTADRVVTVSDYVTRRQLDVGFVPAGRVTRVWNGVRIPASAPRNDSLREELRLDRSRLLIVCCCRAHPVKGVDHVFRAFDAMHRDMPIATRPVLAYIGDGPEMTALRELHASLGSADDIRLLGYRTDAMELLAGADVCVSASVWQEAFGLAVLEPMSLGKAVVATAVGGVPELVVDNECGILVPPADEAALAFAMRRLLDDAPLRSRLGHAARLRAVEHFTAEAQIRSLSALVRCGFGPGTEGVPAAGSPARLAR